MLGTPISPVDLQTSVYAIQQARVALTQATWWHECIIWFPWLLPQDEVEVISSMREEPNDEEECMQRATDLTPKEERLRVKANVQK